LVDSGGGRKLERFGAVTLVRPEAQANWRPALAKTEWEAAQGEYVFRRASKRTETDLKRGKPRGEKDEREERREKRNGEKGEWKFPREAPKRWEMRRGKLAFWVEATPAGHVGVFPDQAAHWDWMSGLIEEAGAKRKSLVGGAEAAAGKESLAKIVADGRAAGAGATAGAPRVLSLFGYTGLATLACAAAGAQVTHVDASAKAIKWARENQALSGLGERPIRWLIDDGPTFVAREIRRGRAYDGLILDPPRFGRGPKGELWKVAEALPELLRQCRKILSATPLFVLLNTYTTVLTRGETAREAARLEAFLGEMLADVDGVRITSGELVLRDRAEREISCSVFARARMAGPQVS
jgi:23S rRNA (cytosine1962-C5)-methyltransferase